MLNHSLTYGPLHHQRQQLIVSDSTMQTYLLIVMFIIQVLIGVLVVVIWACNQYDNNRLEVLLPPSVATPPMTPCSSTPNPVNKTMSENPGYVTIAGRGLQELRPIRKTQQ